MVGEHRHNSVSAHNIADLWCNSCGGLAETFAKALSFCSLSETSDTVTIGYWTSRKEVTFPWPVIRSSRAKGKPPEPYVVSPFALMRLEVVSIESD